MPNAIIIGVGSDIAKEVSYELNKNGWKVFGTVREKDEGIPNFFKGLVNDCDLSFKESIEESIIELNQICDNWDVLVIAVGTLEPIGMYDDIDEEEWNKSLLINFINQVHFVRRMLPSARLDPKLEPLIIFFAGGGTNSATIGFSAYTISKIALIKMTELLDAEYSQFRFVIIGPGWVETKIHNQTLNNLKSPPSALKETERRLNEKDFIPMEKVIDTVMWALSAPKNIIGGRNFSVANDPIKSFQFLERIKLDNNLLKLRRYGNDALEKDNI